MAHSMFLLCTLALAAAILEQQSVSFASGTAQTQQVGAPVATYGNHAERSALGVIKDISPSPRRRFRCGPDWC